MQNDYCNGSMAVGDSLQIIPLINRLKTEGKFDYVFTTRDWHPEDHVSFAR